MAEQTRPLLHSPRVVQLPAYSTAPNRVDVRPKPHASFRRNDDRSVQFHYAAANIPTKDEDVVVVEEGENWTFAGVYDGSAGRIAADYLAKTLHPVLVRRVGQQMTGDLDSPLCKPPTPPLAVAQAMRDAFRSCESTLCESTTTRCFSVVPTYGAAGACAAIALVMHNVLTVAHAGTCRAIVCSIVEKAPKLVHATRDHAYQDGTGQVNRAEVDRVNQAGGKFAAGADRTKPHRLVGSGLLPSRGFGFYSTAAHKHSINKKQQQHKQQNLDAVGRNGNGDASSSAMPGERKGNDPAPPSNDEKEEKIKRSKPTGMLPSPKCFRLPLRPHLHLCLWPATACGM